MGCRASVSVVILLLVGSACGHVPELRAGVSPLPASPTQTASPSSALPTPTQTASPSPTPIPTAIPSPTPATPWPPPSGTGTAKPSLASPLAVIVYHLGAGKPYILQLVGLDGRGGSWVEPMSRSPKTFYFPATACPSGGPCANEAANDNLPETSGSATHVYFLDGDTLIGSLAPDGTVALVETVNAPPNSQVVFSVSPDEQRIAISIITLATSASPNTLDVHMYVEDLVGGSKRVDLYSSTTLAEWPVGWHANNLVVGVGAADIATSDNPYGATGYLVIDPTTGARLVSLDCAYGLLVAAGTACPPLRDWRQQAWDGTQSAVDLHGWPMPAGRVLSGLVTHLSPDGAWIAAASGPPPLFVETTGSNSGGYTAWGVPLGWLDNTHLVVSSPSELEVVDITGAVTPVAITGLKTIPQQGEPALAGTLPANLG
jgi:hypothetical protein